MPALYPERGEVMRWIASLLCISIGFVVMPDGPFWREAVAGFMFGASILIDPPPVRAR